MHRKRLFRALLAFVLVLVLLTATGALAATPQIWGYSEGLALATDGKLWGYADAKGNIVIPIQYDSALQFSLGLALVKRQYRMGVIRQDGTYLITPEYDTLTHINSGVYIAQRGDRWGLVSILPFSDGTGGTTNVLYPFEYDEIKLTQAGGLDVLSLTKGKLKSLLPLFQLTQMLLERGVPSARFPLQRNALPTYSDVGPRDWYALWVDLSYNLDLMEGIGGGQFAPNQKVTVAEVLKLAACLESRTTADDFHRQVQTDAVWYRPYLNYCVASGIIQAGEFSDMLRPVTRAEMAKLFSATTLGKTMAVINSPERVRAELPDVKAGDYAADAIYSLYAKGIIGGTGSGLRFAPQAQLTRAEAAAIVSRMAREEERVRLWSAASRAATLPPAPLTQESVQEGLV